MDKGDIEKIYQEQTRMAEVIDMTNVAVNKLDAGLSAHKEEVKNTFNITINECLVLNKELKLRIIHQERISKRKNLIFFGMKHDTQKEAEDAVMDTIQEKLETPLNVHFFDQIFCLGKQSDAPILVQFTTEKNMWEVLKKSKNLKGTGVVVARDMPREMKQLEKKNLEVLKEARKSKKKIAWKGNDLIVDGKVIDQLIKSKEVEFK